MNTTTTQTKVSKPQEGKRDEYGMTAANWKRLNAMTEEDVLAAARSEPNALPTEDYPPGRLGPPRRVSFAKHIRFQLGLSQADFAAAFRIPLGTLRDWEQHRREPDQAARSYLEVIACEPDVVRRTLAAAGKQKRAPAR